AVTFVAVLALAVVNQVTRGLIEQAEINARAEVYKVVYADASGFAEIENSDSVLENSAAVLEKEGFKGCVINDALAVTGSSGDIQGYVIAATSPQGYGGDVQVAVGITKDGVIKGVSVVANSETAGIGSKCTEPEFTNQFANKNAEILEYTKSGASADNQIDAMSGATISTNAVTEAVNTAIVFYNSQLKGE
ncbi:MAG: RnfABCDGE type electron transport complex subunit G, partial [Eubacterium sp.]